MVIFEGDQMQWQKNYKVLGGVSVNAKCVHWVKDTT